ncbi:hypothetical protein AVEN_92868-1 [Araneus ventricosus]|uniref:Uncharacterized protein n=1 Tax=Araneus ventricosus TaxID=182803 RepID=A0A4Y2S844_ARAVE|nr:hypothetical protein AVEN_92868-1 [Araneus ventricosus]
MGPLRIGIHYLLCLGVNEDSLGNSSDVTSFPRAGYRFLQTGGDLCSFVLMTAIYFCSGDPSAQKFSLVILTSRFEATRGLFWDGPRNFEPRSDDESDA